MADLPKLVLAAACHAGCRSRTSEPAPSAVVRIDLEVLTRVAEEAAGARSRAGGTRAAGARAKQALIANDGDPLASQPGGARHREIAKIATARRAACSTCGSAARARNARASAAFVGTSGRRHCRGYRAGADEGASGNRSASEPRAATSASTSGANGHAGTAATTDRAGAGVVDQARTSAAADREHHHVDDDSESPHRPSPEHTVCRARQYDARGIRPRSSATGVGVVATEVAVNSSSGRIDWFASWARCSRGAMTHAAL